MLARAVNAYVWIWAIYIPASFVVAVVGTYIDPDPSRGPDASYWASRRFLGSHAWIVLAATITLVMILAAKGLIARVNESSTSRRQAVPRGLGPYLVRASGIFVLVYAALSVLFAGAANAYLNQAVGIFGIIKLALAALSMQIVAADWTEFRFSVAIPAQIFAISLVCGFLSLLIYDSWMIAVVASRGLNVMNQSALPRVLLTHLGLNWGVAIGALSPWVFFQTRRRTRNNGGASHGADAA